MRSALLALLLIHSHQAVQSNGTPLETDDVCIVKAAALSDKVEALEATREAFKSAFNSVENLKSHIDNSLHLAVTYEQSINNQSLELHNKLNVIQDRQKSLVAKVDALQVDIENVAQFLEHLPTRKLVGNQCSPTPSSNNWEMTSKLDQILAKLDKLEKHQQCQKSLANSQLKVIEGHKFLLTEQRLKWKEAGAYCTSQGLALGILDSDEKNKVISTATPNTDWYHTSGSDIGRSAGEFYWQNGQKVKWALFKNGDPDDFRDGKETCVFLKNLKLWDYMCDYETFAICEPLPECT